MNLKAIWNLLKDSASEWSADNAMRLGASLAYYTMLSVAPLLVVIAFAQARFLWRSRQCAPVPSSEPFVS